MEWLDDHFKSRENEERRGREIELLHLERRRDRREQIALVLSALALLISIAAFFRAVNLDVHWQSPVCPQCQSVNGHAAQNENHGQLHEKHETLAPGDKPDQDASKAGMATP